MKVWNYTQLQETLKRISFAPSCVDMQWRWVITALPSGYGWNIKTSFVRPDTSTGQVSTGYGREWYIKPGTHADGVIKTAYLAAQQILVHELMEAFHVDNSRIFNPHAPLNELVNLNQVNEGSEEP